MTREEAIWAAAFAKHYDVSAAKAFVQLKGQSRGEFDAVVASFEAEQAWSAARAADAAVMASRLVDALSLGEGLF